MARYVTLREWSDDVGDVMDARITVFEPDDAPAFTGLYDASGNRLYRASDRRPIVIDPRRWRS